MKTFIISDTHFNHQKMIPYCGRPENFNEIIISNWNKMVNDHDLVIHLGDVILGRNSELSSIMGRLNGTKILCRGNHDGESNAWYIDRGFSFVCDNFMDKGIIYSHVPVTPLPEQAKLNVHGHFHNSDHRSPHNLEKPDYYDKRYYLDHEEKYRLIQIEDALSPFLLQDVLSDLKQNKKEERE